MTPPPPTSATPEPDPDLLGVETVRFSSAHEALSPASLPTERHWRKRLASDNSRRAVRDQPVGPRTYQLSYDAERSRQRHSRRKIGSVRIRRQHMHHAFHHQPFRKAR
jgi:hypothetical protein